MTPNRRFVWVGMAGLLLVGAVLVASIVFSPQDRTDEKVVPSGYKQVLHLTHRGQRLSFGPFVGYYFRPENPDAPERVEFLCRNERSFYTQDVPADTLLFVGDGVLTTLPDTGRPIPSKGRINPVFFSDAPEAWTATRPVPQEAYRHFHSCHDESGAVRTGYWLRHEAQATFTYDMSGRVSEQSPLYHEVTPGVDRAFAEIIEFDHGPDF